LGYFYRLFQLLQNTSWRVHQQIRVQRKARSLCKDISRSISKWEFFSTKTHGFPQKKEIEVSRDSKVRSDEASWDEDPESVSAPKSEGLSFLSGNWQGSYTLKTDSQKKTTWRNCHLEFTYENGQGKIRGTGESLWNEEVIPFKVSGTFDLKQQWVTLVKVHTQKYKTLTYNLHLDLKQLLMRGESSHGTLILTKERVSSKKQPTYTDFDKSMLKVLPEPVVTSSPRSSKSPDPISSSSALPSRDSFGTQPAPSGRCSLSPSSRGRRSFYDSTERFGERRFNDVALEKVRRSGVRDNESGPSFVVRSDLDSRGSSSIFTASRSGSFDVKHADLSVEQSDDRSHIYHMYRTLIDKFIEKNKQQYAESESYVLPEISDSFFSKKQAETLAEFRSRHHISDEDHAQVLTHYRVKDGSISPSAPMGVEEFSTMLQSKKSYEQELGPDVQQDSLDENPSPYKRWNPLETSSLVVVPTAVVQPSPVASTSEIEEDDSLMPEMSGPSAPPPPLSLPAPSSPSSVATSASTGDIPPHSPPRERQSSSDSGELSERETCIVCFNARIDCVILPCGHLGICMSCCSELDICPLCRGPIRYAQKIFRA